MGAGQNDLEHLFGIQPKAVARVVHLSLALNGRRRLTAWEAKQVCGFMTNVQPTVRADWEIAPVAGELKASITRMSMRNGQLGPGTSWHFPVARLVGQFFHDGNIGSGRAVSAKELFQLRAMGGPLKHAHCSWLACPLPDDPAHLEIRRWIGRRTLAVAKVRIGSHEAVLARRRRTAPLETSWQWFSDERNFFAPGTSRFCSLVGIGA